MERAPDTARRLPTALTAPPPRPRAMPTQEILIWTPRRMLGVLYRAFIEGLVPSRDVRASRRT